MRALIMMGTLPTKTDVWYLRCCVFLPAFGCCAQLNADQNSICCFQPFLLISNIFCDFSPDTRKKWLKQGNLIQGKAQVALKNWKNLFEDQREDSLTSLEVCKLLKSK